MVKFRQIGCGHVRDMWAASWLQLSNASCESCPTSYAPCVLGVTPDEHGKIRSPRSTSRPGKCWRKMARARPSLTDLEADKMPAHAGIGDVWPSWAKSAQGLPNLVNGWGVGAIHGFRSNFVLGNSGARRLRWGWFPGTRGDQLVIFRAREEPWAANGPKRANRPGRPAAALRLGSPAVCGASNFRWQGRQLSSDAGWTRCLRGRRVLARAGSLCLNRPIQRRRRHKSPATELRRG